MGALLFIQLVEIIYKHVKTIDWGKIQIAKKIPRQCSKCLVCSKKMEKIYYFQLQLNKLWIVWHIVLFANRNEYTQLSIQYQPLSLAHGFSDYHVPKYITDALAAATKDPNCLLNQYASGYVSKSSSKY